MTSDISRDSAEFSAVSHDYPLIAPINIVFVDSLYIKHHSEKQIS